MEKANKKQRPHIEMGKAEDKEEEEDFINTHTHTHAHTHALICTYSKRGK